MRMTSTKLKGGYFRSFWLSAIAALLLTLGKLQAQTNAVPATALDFDGANDFVQVNNFGTAPAAYSMELWFKDEGGSGFQNLVGWLGRRPFGIPIWREIQQIVVGTQPNGTLRFGIFDYVNFDFPTLNGSTNVRDGQWHHVAVVTNGNTHSLIVDGVLEASGVSSASNTVENYVQYLRIGAQGIIGIDPGPTEKFNGKIDEVRIWSRALTVAEVIVAKNCQLTGDEPNLLAYYNFNQGFVDANNSTETSLIDRTGNGRNGSLTNFILNGNNSNWGAGNPALTINCNDLDNDGVLNGNDCDPLDASKWRNGNFYTDADGDGYGAGDAQELCYGNNTPAGFATVAGDCNDGNAAINPAATEICDGIDNNCNGSTDEGFPDFDNDGTKDCVDTDDDNDGVPDAYDCEPFDQKKNKWLVCHNGNTICIAQSAVAAHLAHGDQLGACPTAPRGGMPVVTDHIYDFNIINAPNPARSQTTIRYELPADSRVTITLFDPMGKMISTLVDAKRPAGKYFYELDVSKLAPGVYYYRMNATAEGENFSRVQKLMITH